MCEPIQESALPWALSLATAKSPQVAAAVPTGDLQGRVELFHGFLGLFFK